MKCLCCGKVAHEGEFLAYKKSSVKGFCRDCINNKPKIVTKLWISMINS